MDNARASVSVRLLIADDQELVRESMKDMLSNEPDLQIVGEAADGLEAVERSRQERPDLVLMDVRMPHMDGLAATRVIKQERPQTSVLVVTMHENPDYLVEALRAGAAGYILKDATHGDLISAIRAVRSGESPLDPELAAKLLRRLVAERGRAREAPPEPTHHELLHPLSPREIEVLEQLALGRTNREIAQEFWISMGTVKRHVENLIWKLGVSDRTQAAVWALELGIISFPHE